MLIHGRRFGEIYVEGLQCKFSSNWLVFETFKGEVLIEVASSTASVDFDWVVPWDSTLVQEVSVGEQVFGYVLRISIMPEKRFVLGRRSPTRKRGRTDI